MMTFHAALKKDITSWTPANTTYQHFFNNWALPHSSDEINTFIVTHQLPAGVALAKAHFWTPAQAAFINQALLHDSDWAEVADDLAARLTFVAPH
jgi:hypothetical protein